MSDENKIKVNPFTVDDENWMLHPSKNFDIFELELLLQGEETKHYKFIQKTASSTTVLNKMSPEKEVDLVAIQKDNDIQRKLQVTTLPHTF